MNLSIWMADLFRRDKEKKRNIINRYKGSDIVECHGCLHRVEEETSEFL